MDSVKLKRGLVWLRRDLRLDDHAALSQALQRCEQVWLLFVFDQEIIVPLLEQGLVGDRRMGFIYASLVELDTQLRNYGSALIVRSGMTRACVPEIARALDVDGVWVNHDYEPSAIERDLDVKQSLQSEGRYFFSMKDQVIFEKNEVLTASAHPFSVFTPYKNAWLKQLLPTDLEPYPVEPYIAALAAVPQHLEQSWPSLDDLGFNPKELAIMPGMRGAQELLRLFMARIDHYHIKRDYPAVRGGSYLSVHLRFGTISVRVLANLAYRLMLTGNRGAEVWLSELIWRDFYFMILYHHPRLAAGAAFKSIYDAIQWRQGEEAQILFAAWCAGRTGYPLVDAAMRQLNKTGFMHNRLRMLVASFLTKDLGIDWRWGERYFAQQLNDFDFAANNGGWQWAASTGCDAQPYFRIFNPVTQSKKFDAEGRFIRRYVPELANLPTQWIHAPWLAPADVLLSSAIEIGKSYPRPIVAHDLARQETLARYAVVKI